MSNLIKFEPRWLDQQLLSSGAYNPLYSLLDAGLLAYTDYENWRCGISTSLDAYLNAELEAVGPFLKNAVSYAGKLGLVVESQTYYLWKSDTSRVLVTSTDKALAEALNVRWRRPESVMQLDIFMDNSAVVTENQLCDALANHQWSAAQTACQQLVSLAPQNPALAHYESLIAYGLHVEANPTIPPEECLDEFNGLESEVQPLAREHLAQQARDYLALAWRRMAENLATTEFNAENPQCHASYAWSQLAAWPKVIESILAVPDWQAHFALVQRMANACLQQRQQEQGLLCACALFLLDTAAAEALLAQDDNFSRLKTLWQSFVDLDESLPDALFPAYLLIAEPGLILHLNNSTVPHFHHSAVQVTADLLEKKRAGEDEIPHRLRLREISPTLLKIYLGRR